MSIQKTRVVVDGLCKVTRLPFQMVFDYETFADYLAGIIPASAFGNDAERWLTESISPMGWALASAALERPALAQAA